MDIKKVKTKRIGIDARFYGPLGKGLGRYTQEVVDNIIKLDQDNEYVIFLRRENFDEFITDNPKVKKVLAAARWYSLAEQIIMPWLIFKERFNLIHFPHFNVPIFTPVKFVVSIHDLILTKYPTKRSSRQLYWLKNLGYRLVIWLAIWRAKKILTASQYSKNDLIGRFKIKSEKILVVNYGASNLKQGQDLRFVKKLDNRKTLLSYSIIGNFILYVGSAYPHKNLEMLLAVFFEFYKKYPDFRLMLVGCEDYFYRYLKQKAEKMELWREKDQTSPVIFAGYIPDAELEVLYQQACFYIFPSLYEGFGLPPLEAMAKGCPVLSSNRSCLPEILGKAALYFNPKDKNDMLIKMEKITSDKNLREALIKKGYEQSKKYNWRECARQTLDVYRSIARL